MLPRSLEYICSACGGELHCGNPQMLVTGVTTDSRQVSPGDLFVAIKGDRFDGHDFLTQVARKGAAALVLRREKVPAESRGPAIISVPDTRRAYGLLAARYRSDFQLPVIVIGGSNGKTTTKELLAAVLRQKFNTLWSEASFNNDIGVPSTLLKLNPSHQAAILEAGTNHPGELAPLMRMICPQLGAITTIGREHLEFFGDLDGVAREEGVIAELLPPHGTLFLNGDNEFTPGVMQRAKAPAVRVGLHSNNDWRADYLRTHSDGVTFTVTAPRSDYNGEYRLQLLGRHQVLNALFAIAIGAELELFPAEIRRGLASCKPAKMRMEVIRAGGVTILNDAYNANADSMQAALDTLHDYPAVNRRVAVLGTMAELGGHSLPAHEEIGRCAARCGVAHLAAVGAFAEPTCQAARAAGLSSAAAFADVPAAITALKSFLRPGDVVLLKASRAAAFERIALALSSE